MGKLKQFLLSDRNITRDSYLWNTIAGMVNAFQSVIILMVITRTNSTYDAGVFALGYSTACLFLTIGNYGMRSYQVTDVTGHFHFGDYLGSRVLSCGAMLVVSCAYCLYGRLALGHSAEKTAVILVICLIKMLEAVEDVYFGMYQNQKRLDIASRASGLRLLITTVCFCVLLAVFKNLLLASAVTLAVSALVCLLFLRVTLAYFPAQREKPRYRSTGRLLYTCLGVFISAFLSMYIVNAPKYAIDAALPQEMQAYYGYVAMPVFVVGLLNNFLYQPILVSLAEDWNSGKLGIFVKRIVKQHLIIAGLTLATLIGGYFLGIPVLSWLYNADLTPYLPELMILLLGGGLLAASGFVLILITLIRRQKTLIPGYGAVAAAAYFLSPILVGRSGLMGAAWGYTIFVGALCVLFEGIMAFFIVKEKKRLRAATSAAK